MKFSPSAKHPAKPLVNPVLQTPDSISPQTTVGHEWALPRHIPQAKPLTVPGTKPAAPAEPYSPEDSLNLCPTLNFYQRANPESEEWNRLHLENLRQNLERRLQAAKEAGNDPLVKTLEQEFQELALSESRLG